MRISKIILNSLWVLFSFIPFINGFGFIYMGLKIKNNAWIIEGITYELPWFLFVINAYMFEGISFINAPLIIIIFLLFVICIIRSIWVNFKYIKFINDIDGPTEINVSNNGSISNKNSHTASIALGYFFSIFIGIIGLIFAIYNLTRDDESTKIHGKIQMLILIVFNFMLLLLMI